MRSLLLIGVFLLAAPAAEACTRLPAANHTAVRLERGVLRVCVDGRTVEVARGVAKASAAGHRVAWVYQRRGKELVATVKLARVGREVKVLRRFTVLREKGPKKADLDVLLFRPDELAWLASGWDEGAVSLYRKGRPVRTLEDGTAYSFALEDDRTLVWTRGDEYGFFDLRHRPCPSRSRAVEVARNAQAIVTRAEYDGGELSVLRGCDPATGRDRQLAQISSDTYQSVDLDVIGLDRSWALLSRRTSDDKYEAYTQSLIAVDVASGRTRSAFLYESGIDTPAYPAPTVAAGFAITADGVTGWLADGVLYGMVGGRVTELDRGGVIADLRAHGHRLVWTRDGEARSYFPD
jgi:hypothetical protein